MSLAIQIISLGNQNIFKRYSAKYNIFRDLYEVDLLGLELRNADSSLVNKLREIVLSSQEICYSVENNGESDFLILGSFTVFKELIRKILPSGNEDIGYKLKNVLNNHTNYVGDFFLIDGKKYFLNKSYVIGIVNVTRDSFSDGGKYYSHDDAYEHCCNLLESGADIIDIGGESTRPGSKSISCEEEIKHVIPLIENLIHSFPKTIISVDTTKAEVAKQALDKGAKIINDISSFNFDIQMKEVIKEYNASVILMHMKGKPENMQDNPTYSEVVNEVYDFLNGKIIEAKSYGIKSIIIDPGIGFGKRVSDNYELLRRLKEFKGLGTPILIGLSRKSFIGKALNLDIMDREDATLSAETIAILNGANFIRTHNVKNTKQAIQMMNYINNPESIPSV